MGKKKEPRMVKCHVCNLWTWPRLLKKHTPGYHACWHLGPENQPTQKPHTPQINEQQALATLKVGSAFTHYLDGACVVRGHENGKVKLQFSDASVRRFDPVVLFSWVSPADCFAFGPKAPPPAI